MERSLNEVTGSDCNASKPTGDLNLPASNCNSGLIAIIQISIQDLHRAAAKIRSEIEIKIMKHRPGENRTGAAQQKAVVAQ